MKRIYQPDEGDKTLGHLRIESGEPSNQDARNENSASVSASTEIDMYTEEEVDSDLNKQLQLYDPQANLALMQNISDDHFLLIVEHIRL